MIRWIKYVDRVMRGDATHPSSLRDGEIDQPVGGLTVVGIVLGAVYGVCMGCFGLFQHRSHAILQLVTTTAKVPLLFFLTLIVTFPSLYVFNALVGSRLSAQSILRLLVISVIVTLTVLASLGPIVAFFSASTTSYPFMVLLNVIIFAVSGCLGLRYMVITLQRLTGETHRGSFPIFTVPPLPARAAADIRVRSATDTPDISGTSMGGAAPQTAAIPGPTAFGEAPQPGAASSMRAQPPTAPGPMDGRVLDYNVRTVFRIWMTVFALVGAQMAWVLRPFLGSPNAAFTVLRGRESNFFEGLFHILGKLFT